MNTTEWLERVRQTGSLPSESENWGDAEILDEGTQALRTRFAEEIVNTSSGYWRHQLVFTPTAGQSEYRIPARAVAQGLQKFEVSRDGGQTWNLMRVLTLGSDGLSESTRTGLPAHYTHYSDYVRVFPTPDASSTTRFRFTFYLSPSQLVPATTLGTVTQVLTPTTFRVDGDPTSIPLDPAGGTLDVVNTNGCCEVVLFDVPYTSIVYTGSGDLWDVTVPNTVDLSRVAAGQVIRIADTTDQIPLIRELQNSFAAYTAAMILLNSVDAQQGEKLASKVSGDITRIIDLAVPRDKAHPKKIKPRNSPLRRHAGYRWR